MNWVDVVIVIILIIGLFKGLVNGFVRGLFGLVALVLGIAIAAGKYADVRDVLLFRLPTSVQIQNVLSFLLIFVVVMLLVNILGNIISRALKLAALGWIDRLAGGALGLFMSCLFIGVLLMIAVLAGFHENNAVARSNFAPAVIRVMDTALLFAPEEARARIEAQYLKLRAEWEKARKEPEQKEEKQGEPGETVASMTGCGPTYAAAAALGPCPGGMALDS
jgi:membrane protein required for colicin V production